MRVFSLLAAHYFAKVFCSFLTGELFIMYDPLEHSAQK